MVGRPRRRSELMVLEARYLLPLALRNLVVSEEVHVLPIDGVGLFGLNVTYGWYLEWEEGQALGESVVFILVDLLNVSALNFCVNQVEITEELTIKPTHDDDLILTQLAHARPLPRRD